MIGFSPEIGPQPEKPGLSEKEIEVWKKHYEKDFSPEEQQKKSFLDFLNERTPYDSLSPEEKKETDFLTFLNQESAKIEQEKQEKE